MRDEVVMGFTLENRPLARLTAPASDLAVHAT